MRRWRQRGPTRLAGAWAPVGVVDDKNLAETMALMLQEEETHIEARAVSAYDVRYKLRAEDRERILDRLSDRTTADIEMGRSLRQAAEARLLERTQERRSGLERRSGFDRRKRRGRQRSKSERRSGGDRRSGSDRRRVRTAA